MIGIYKITNPSGNVYIGQSMDIARRLKTYKNTPNISQIKLYNSIKKYGWDKHIVEIIEECAIDLLNEKEVYYKQKHINDFGWESALFHFIHDIGIS
jgi:group I intron endonuclease